MISVSETAKEKLLSLMAESNHSADSYFVLVLKVGDVRAYPIKWILMRNVMRETNYLKIKE